jgi:hypothetical protein
MAPQPSAAGTPAGAAAGGTPSAAPPPASSSSSAAAAAAAAAADAANPLMLPLRHATSTLYNMMQQSYSHAGAPSTAALAASSHALVGQLADLQRLARAMARAGPAPPPASSSSAAPAGEAAAQPTAEDGGGGGGAPRDVTLPPEVVAYVQDGRNPDIYTREFVELAMRNNQRLRGKADAFARFAGVLAAEIVGACPEARPHVELVLGEDVAAADGEPAGTAGSGNGAGRPAGG